MGSNKRPSQLGTPYGASWVDTDRIYIKCRDISLLMSCCHPFLVRETRPIYSRTDLSDFVADLHTPHDCISEAVRRRRRRRRRSAIGGPGFFLEALEGGREDLEDWEDWEDWEDFEAIYLISPAPRSPAALAPINTDYGLGTPGKAPGAPGAPGAPEAC